MNKEATQLERCRQFIEEKLDWGDSTRWQNQDFETLSGLIFERTHVRLSVSTLKRLWGKIPYDSTPNLSTLNALAQFVGYGSWRLFCTAYSPTNSKKSAWSIQIKWAMVLFAALVLIPRSLLAVLNYQPSVAYHSTIYLAPEHLIGNFQNAFNSCDMRKVLTFYTKDAVMSGFVGQKAITKFWMEMIRKKPFCKIQVNETGGNHNLIYQWGSYTFYQNHRNNTNPTRRDFLLLWEHQPDGSWKIKRDFELSVNPKKQNNTLFIRKRT